MRLPRFTVRRMMVAVAIVALVVSVGIRRYSFAIMAQKYAIMEMEALVIREEREFSHLLMLNGSVKNGEVKLAEVKLISKSPHFIKWQNVAYYSQMKEKYERAARYPWLPVAPDPPEPTVPPEPE